MLIVEFPMGALIALGGGALLLQSKALPSDADAARTGKTSYQMIGRKLVTTETLIF